MTIDPTDLPDFSDLGVGAESAHSEGVNLAERMNLGGPVGQDLPDFSDLGTAEPMPAPQRWEREELDREINPETDQIRTPPADRRVIDRAEAPFPGRMNLGGNTEWPNNAFREPVEPAEPAQRPAPRRRQPAARTPSPEPMSTPRHAEGVSPTRRAGQPGSDPLRESAPPDTATDMARRAFGVPPPADPGSVVGDLARKAFDLPGQAVDTLNREIVQPVARAIESVVHPRSAPASIRFNNPGAMYPGPSAKKFGSSRTERIGGGHLIAVFDTPEAGGAAHFDLLDRRYTGMKLADLIKKWSGGNHSAAYANRIAQATGLRLNTVVTPEMLRDPAIGIPFARAQANWEAGRAHPMTAEQWTRAHALAFGEQAPQQPRIPTDAPPQRQRGNDFAEGPPMGLGGPRDADLPAEANAPDFSDLGTPATAETLPDRINRLGERYGVRPPQRRQAPDFSDLAAPPDFSDLGQQPVGDGFWENAANSQQYIEAGKGVIPGAIKFGGTMLHGAAGLDPGEATATVFDRYREDIARVPSMTPAEVNALKQRIAKDHGGPRGSVAFVPMIDAIEALQAGEITPEQLDEHYPRATPMAERRLSRAGDAVTEFGQELWPAMPGYENSVGRSIGEGLGSLLGGLPFGLAGRLPGALAFGSAGAGEAQQRAIAFDKAERAAGRAGLSEQQIAAATLMGIGPGMTDLAPIEVMLGRMKIPGMTPQISNALARVISQTGGRILTQAVVEGGQEGFQQFLQNVISWTQYNPEQELTAEVLANMGIGSAVGGIAQGGREAAGGMMRLGRRGGHASPTPEAASGEQPPQQALPPPAQSPTPPVGDQSGGPPPPLGPATPPPIPPSADETAILRGANWSDEDIADMTPEQRAAEVEDARQQGVTPRYDLAPDAPTAEPIGDLVAQARDLADPANDRQGLWLPRASLDALLENPDGAHAIREALGTAGIDTVDDLDGQGGYLIVNSPELAEAVRQAKAAGIDHQRIIGALTGAGTGKPANGTAVVQQVDDEGNVTRERVVTPPELSAAQKEFTMQGREVRTVTPEAAIARRAGTPPPLPGETTLRPITPIADAELTNAARGPGAPTNRVRVERPEDIAAASLRVAEPTPAQAEAGNYRKAHVKMGDLDITIETPKGGTRRGYRDGKIAWEVPNMPAAYGYVRGTRGNDGDQVDVFLGDNVASRGVLVIDQIDPDTGEFDEHKAILGANSPDEARAIYEGSYSDGRAAERIGGMTEMSIDEFRDWVSDGVRDIPLTDPELNQEPSSDLDVLIESQEYVDAVAAEGEDADPRSVRLADQIAEEITDYHATEASQPAETAAVVPDAQESAEERTTFTTAKGSTYQVQEDGTTVRDKAARPDPGHEGDEGLKPKSDKTFYVDPKDAQRLAPPQSNKARIVDHGDGTLSVAVQNKDGRWGISPESRNVPVSTEPEVGKAPIELWGKESIYDNDAYKGIHLGNEITEVKRSEPRKPYDGAPLTDAEIDTLVDAWKYVRAHDERGKPQSLAQYVIDDLKGLRDDRREVRQIAGAAKERPALINQNGATLDDAALSAWQQDFFAGQDRPGITTFLDALQDDLHTGEVVRSEDQGYFEDARVASDMAEELADYGVTTSGFRSEASLRRYFGQEGARVASAAPRAEAAQAAPEGADADEQTGQAEGQPDRPAAEARGQQPGDVRDTEDADNRGTGDAAASENAGDDRGSAGAEPAGRGAELGGEEWVTLPAQGLNLKARVDTGAKTSSLHATDMVVTGKRVSFKTVDDVVIEADIVREASVRNANAAKKRQVISIDIKIGDREFPVEVTLADRSKMEYPFLLGREGIPDDMAVRPKGSFLQGEPPPIEVETETEDQARETGPSDSGLPEGVTVELVERTLDDAESQIKGGKYKAIARRESPYSVEDGYGDTPEAAEANALQRLLKDKAPKPKLGKGLADIKPTGGAEAVDRVAGKPDTAGTDSDDAQLHTAQEQGDEAGAEPDNKPDTRVSKSVRSLAVELVGNGFENIMAARRWAKENGIQETGKAFDELLEQAVVFAARATVAHGKDENWEARRVYKQLRELYDNQPNLGVRTSTSVANQAYSTPVPLAYIASRLAGVAGAKTVYEPTAGNGALLIEANPETQRVVANEFNQERAAALERQGFETYHRDATEDNPDLDGADVIIANPPFGAVREAGESKLFENDGFKTTQIDHAIALDALQQMAPNGKAVLILGGIKADSIEERRKGYRGQAKRKFFHRLYTNYNVIDHFTVDGDLYAKQGAGWPVDVVVINGKGKSARTLPAAEPPTIFKTWDSLAEKLDAQRVPVEGGRPVGDSQQAGAPDQAVGQPVDGDGRDRAPDGRRRAERLESPAQNDARPVRRDDDRAEPSDAGSDQRSQERVPSGTVRDAGRPDQQSAAGAERPRVEKKVETKGGQTTYRPSSGAKSVDALVPANMASATRDSLQRTENKHGSLDKYVGERLGYKSDAEGPYFLRKGEKKRPFSAEQIDALAAAIDNIERGSAFIIGDQTGIGKGRVVAGLLRYAIQQKMIPTLVTEKPDLYGDMVRDMNDIGMEEMLGHEPNVLMTNIGENVPLDDEALAWKQEADAAKAAGAPAPKRRGRFLTAGGKAKNEAGMRSVIDRDGKIDMVFTTYDQMNSVKGGETDRRNFLRRIAPDALIAFDESHNAGGQGQQPGKRKPKAGTAPNRAELARDLAARAKAVVFSSATYAKRPDVMDLYARTDMGKAVDDPKKLPELIQKGGVPMQQIVASMLADAGQYMRRERSFDGVKYDVKGVPVNAESYKQFSHAIRSVFQFDLAVKESREEFMQDILDEMGFGKAKDSGVGEGAAHTTAFASVMHNIVNQMLLSIKAEATAVDAIAARKVGEKPVIYLANTMESFISDFAGHENIKAGDAINITFADVLARYLARTLRITVKDPDDKKTHIDIPVAKLPNHLQRMYRDALDAINDGNYDGLPVSPIDWMRHRLTKAGLSVAEVTGRQTMIDYGAKDAPKYTVRPKSEMGAAGKRSSIAAFNNGRLDALIINRSGSTGVSMHSGENYKDQSRRHMLIAQAEGNVDTHLQALGRVHRTGQVITPKYSQIAAEIPAEARPTAVLMKKMASLNANTTGARGSVFMADAVDFMNEVGDKVWFEVLLEDSELNRNLGYALKEDAEGRPSEEDAARRATGRLVLLDPAEQSELLDRVTKAYKAEIERLDAIGENILEAKTIDLQAKTVDATPLKDKTGEGPFLDAARIEKVSAKAQGRAMKFEDVAASVAEAMKQPKGEGNPAQLLEQLERKGREFGREQVEATRKRAIAWISSDVAAKSDDAQATTRQRHEEALRRWLGVTAVAYPGARVTLGLLDGPMDGVVLSVERTGKAKNPVALSTWSVTIAVPASERQFIFPMSKLFGDNAAKSDDEPGATITASGPRAGTRFNELAERFEEARKEGRETRYIVTGNILAGYDQVNGRGQIVNFTNDKGELRPGVLMGRDFKVDKFMDSRAIRMTSGAQVAEFLDKAPTARVGTTDKLADLYVARGAYRIEVPASRATGGRYYTDPAVMKSIKPDEFIKRGNKMVAELSRDQFVAAVDAMRKAGALFETTSEQELAQEIVKKTGGMQAAIAAGVEARQPLTLREDGVVKWNRGDKADLRGSLVDAFWRYGEADPKDALMIPAAKAEVKKEGSPPGVVSRVTLMRGSDEIGYVDYVLSRNNDTAFITFFSHFGRDRGDSGFSMRDMRELREEFRRLHPTVTNFQGRRVSGARSRSDTVSSFQSVMMMALASSMGVPRVGEAATPRAFKSVITDIRQIIAKRLAEGTAVTIRKQAVDAVHAAAAPMMQMVPEGAGVYALSRLEPGESAGEMSAIYLDRDGNEAEVPVTWEKLSSARAFHLSGDIFINRLSPPRGDDVLGQFNRNVTAELGHEVIHLLHKSGRLRGDRWNRLLAHAKALHLLDGQFGTYLKTVGDPSASMVDPDVTVREAYEKYYEGREDYQEVMDEEEVAHIVEWYLRGQLSDAEVMPVWDIVSDILGGRIGGEEVSAADVATEIAAAIASEMDEEGASEWEDAHFAELSRRAHHIEEAVGRSNQRSVAGQRKDPMEQAADAYAREVSAFERSQSGLPIAERAAAIEAKYGFPVSAADLQSGNVWWRVTQSQGGRRWSPEAKAELARLYLAGKSQKEIVEALEPLLGYRLKPTAIHPLRVYNGIKKRPSATPPIRPEIRSFILDKIRAGLDSGEIERAVKAEFDVRVQQAYVRVMKQRMLRSGPGMAAAIGSDIQASAVPTEAPQPRTNAAGFVLRLPFKDKWGDPRFNEEDREAALGRLREIQTMPVKEVPWKDLVEARDDIQQITASIFYYRPDMTDAEVRGFDSDLFFYVRDVLSEGEDKIAAKNANFFRDDLPEDGSQNDVRDFQVQGRQALDHLLSSNRRGVGDLVQWGHALDADKEPKSYKAYQPKPERIGETMPSGFYFKSGRLLSEVPDTLFNMGGSHVINALMKKGVRRPELEHFKLIEKFSNKKPVTREEFAQAIADRMFDFKRKVSVLNPEVSRKDYELGGTRAFRGPRIPGRAIYFEELAAFPKRLKDRTPFAPGHFISPHWKEELEGTWASRRGSIREVPGWGTVVVGEEEQTDFMQGALGTGDNSTGRRPRISQEEYLSRVKAEDSYDDVMRLARNNVDYILDVGTVESVLDADMRSAVRHDLVPWPHGSGNEYARDQWDNALATLRQAVLDSAQHLHMNTPSNLDPLGFKTGLAIRRLDELKSLRDKHEAFFAPGGRAKYFSPREDYTPASPLDEGYVGNMARSLLIAAARRKADAVAIPTTETNDRIQINTHRSAGHFYDKQLKPRLERELRAITGDHKLTLEIVKLPKAMGQARNQKAYEVWAARISPETRAKILKGLPMMSAVPTAGMSQKQKTDLAKDMQAAAAIVDRVAGEVPVWFQDTIRTEDVGINPEQAAGDLTARTLGGYYQRGRVDGNVLIGLATNDPSYDLKTSAGHEAWHHVEEAYASDPEKRLLNSSSELARMARTLVAPEIGMKPDDPRLQSLQPAEIRAIAFGRYRRLKEEGAPTNGIHIAVRKFFDKVARILQAIKNVMARRTSVRQAAAGSGSFESIFEQARTGAMKGRGGTEPVLSPEQVEAYLDMADDERASVRARLSLATADPAFVARVRKQLAEIEYVEEDESADIQGASTPTDTYRPSLRDRIMARYIEWRYPHWQYSDPNNPYMRPPHGSLNSEGLASRRSTRRAAEVGGMDQRTARDMAMARPANTDSHLTPVESTMRGIVDAVDSYLEGPTKILQDNVRMINAEGVGDVGAFVAVRMPEEEGASVPVMAAYQEYVKASQYPMTAPEFSRALRTLGLRIEKIGGRIRVLGRRLATAEESNLDPRIDPRLEQASRQGKPNLRVVENPDGPPDISASAVPTPGATGLTYPAREGLISRMLGRIPAGDTVRRSLQDRMLAFKRQGEKLERDTGAELPVNLDVYVAESLYHGRAGEQLIDQENEYVEPLIETMRKSDIRADEFGDYLYARHAQERNASMAKLDPDNDAGSGMTDDEANAILASVRASGKQAAFDKAAGIVDAMTEDARKTLLKAGLISREQYDKWSSQWANYVPLRGFEVKDGDNHDGVLAGMGFDIHGREARQALGRRSKSDNPLVYAVMQAQQAIVRAEKNRVAKTLWRTVEAHPDPAVWKVYRGKWGRRVNSETGQVERYWITPNFTRPENVFGVKIGGKQHWIEVKHEGMARALRGRERGMADDLVANYVMPLTRLYAQMLTSWNPEFVLSNALRDMETALINVSDVKNKPAGIRKKIIKDAVSLKSIRGIMAALRDKDGNEFTPWFERYRHAGGKISFMEYNDVERIRGNVVKSINAGKMRRAAAATFRLVSDVNTSVENGVRLSVFRALVENGVNDDRAAFIARELTVNFNRKGELGPLINAFYIFFNASIQATVRIGLAARRSRAARYAIGGLFMMGFVMDLLNYMGAGDDDDGENFYDKIPEWIKARNMLLMIPGRNDYIQVPMGLGYNVPYLAGQQLMAAFRNAGGYGSKTTPLKAALTVASNAFDIFNPIGAAPTATQFIAPTMMDPIVQVAENVSWNGRLIQPTKHDRNKPDSENYFATAPWWAIDTARILNQATGGNRARSGLVDVSPEAIQHYVEFAGGGVAKFALNAYATGERTVTGQEWLPEKTPFLRRVYGKATNESRRRDFQEAWSQADAARYEVQNLAKMGLSAESQAAQRRYATELQSYGAMRGTQKTLSALKTQRDRVNLDRNLTGAQQRARIEEIQKRENDLIVQALKQYNRTRKQARPSDPLPVVPEE